MAVLRGSRCRLVQCPRRIPRAEVATSELKSLSLHTRRRAPSRWRYVCSRTPKVSSLFWSTACMMMPIWKRTVRPEPSRRGRHLDHTVCTLPHEKHHAGCAEGGGHHVERGRRHRETGKALHGAALNLLDMVPKKTSRLWREGTMVAALCEERVSGCTQKKNANGTWRKQTVEASRAPATILRDLFLSTVMGWLAGGW